MPIGVRPARLGAMSSIEHPSLSLYVSDIDRERAEDLLKDAYAAGRIGEAELDRRLGQVMTARTRRDLNASFYGVVPLGTQMAASLPATTINRGTGMASVAHFSVFFLWLLGPVLFFLTAAPRSYARREAAKAFNFQFVSFLVMIATVIVAGIFDIGALVGIGALGWFVLTIVGGLKAAQGENWHNPVTRIIPVQVLSEKK